MAHACAEAIESRRSRCFGCSNPSQQADVSELARELAQTEAPQLARPGSARLSGCGGIAWLSRSRASQSQIGRQASDSESETARLRDKTDNVFSALKRIKSARQ